MTSHNNYPNLLRFDYTAEELLNISQTAISQKKQGLDELAQITDPTWENFVQVYHDIDWHYGTVASICYFPSQVSPDKSLRMVVFIHGIGFGKLVSRLMRK